jgi:hypothetical protein
VTGPGFGVVPERVREVGQQVVQISQDVGSIVSSGAATIQLAGSGNAGFLATPAMAALTAAHLAALGPGAGAGGRGRGPGPGAGTGGRDRGPGPGAGTGPGRGDRGRSRGWVEWG